MSNVKKFALLVLVLLLMGGGFLTYSCAQSKALISPPPSSLTATVDVLDIFDIYFTPYENGSQKLLELLDRALETGEAHPSIYVASFTYTNADIAAKLIELDRKGVEVHVIMDKRQVKAIEKEQVLFDEMLAGGVEVVMGSSEGGDIMHHKYIIVNKKWMYLGCFNLTPNADKQNNFLLVCKKDKPQPHLAEKLLEDWQRMHTFMTTGERTLPRKRRTR